VSHIRRGRGFRRLNEIATHRLGQEVFETHRRIHREKGCDVSVVVVGSARLTASGAIMTRIAPCVIGGLTLGLSACANPYDPVERGLGGGLWGAASGAAIGAAAGGGPGAALGAAIGGATGVVAGVASTPPPGTYYGYPAYGRSAYGYPGYAQPGYGNPGYSAYPAYSGSPSYGSPTNSEYPAYSGPPAYGYQSRPPYSPYSGSGYEDPVAGYPGKRPSEDWSPGAEYPIEPSN
jgi:hypothetical protein